MFQRASDLDEGFDAAFPRTGGGARGHATTRPSNPGAHAPSWLLEPQHVQKRRRHVHSTRASLTSPHFFTLPPVTFQPPPFCPRFRVLAIERPDKLPTKTLSWQLASPLSRAFPLKVPEIPEGQR